MPNQNNVNNLNSTDTDTDIGDFVDGDDRLSWLAFCYVADELTEVQRADFENHLADDLDYQQALADAVGLGRALMESHGRVSPSVEKEVKRAE